MSVVDVPSGAGEGVLDHERAVGGRDVNELAVAGDVAGGPDPRVGAGQPARHEDLAFAIGLDVDVAQVQPFGDREPTRRDQDPAGTELVNVTRDGRGRDDSASFRVGADGGDSASRTTRIPSSANTSSSAAETSGSSRGDSRDRTHMVTREPSRANS